jgi:hypothetical protein
VAQRVTPSRWNRASTHIRIVRDHFHPRPFQFARDDGSDPAEADDARGLAPARSRYGAPAKIVPLCRFIRRGDVANTANASAIASSPAA